MIWLSLTYFVGNFVDSLTYITDTSVLISVTDVTNIPILFVGSAVKAGTYAQMVIFFLVKL